ncbi:MAG: YebC/PmpR family DNA-binding transcriptional regulator [Candidatus Pacebacteria bacterium]|nr:YebC/PmpR family DNA-binding transcriptional regulator [Candidatus Paceibacterota bacterium]
MSGHNKWSKIKHKKAATDAVRSKIFSKHSSLITMEAKKANGDINSAGLLAAVERAKKDSMPKENIDRALAKGSGTDSASLQEVLFEAFGPGGVAILITAVTDNNNRTNQEIKHIFTKAGFQLGAPGSAIWAFIKNDSGYHPTTPLQISDEDGEKLANLIDQLEDQDDVQDIFTTADDIN